MSWELAIQVLAVFSVIAAGYLLLVRPQLQRQTAHRDFLSSLRVGDEVVTRGGLVGRIAKMDNGPVLEIEFSDSVRVRALKLSIECILVHL